MKKIFFVAGVTAVFSAFAARDTHETVKQGVWKTFEYAQPTELPIVFSGWSKAENADAADYCIWLDLHYDNGEAVWGRKAEFRCGTHDWEEARAVFVPSRPVVKITALALFRGRGEMKARGKVSFGDFRLERRDGNGETYPLTKLTDRPFSNADEFSAEVFRGREVTREKRLVPRSDPMTSPVAAGTVAVWTEDSMRLVTPLTFPAAQAKKSISLSLAKRERESAQILLSAAADTEWKAVTLDLPVLRKTDGTPLKGAVSWQRQGYLAREYGANPHPFAFPADEKWFPDPLMPPAPMRVRKASTQGAWVTVYAAPEAEAGEYFGEVTVRDGDVEKAKVLMTVSVEPFALPATFGLETAYALMDGYTRALYPDDFRAKKREAIDIMLDHRLNPDDISRTIPPDIDDLLYARNRGMNRFNILNIVPPPKDPKARCVLVAKPEDIFNGNFYEYFIGTVKPYVAELRKHGLDKYAYIYGFDERKKEFYGGIDAFWTKLKRDVPGIPLMTTAKNYQDFAAGRTNIPHLVTGDWYCPTTQVYDRDVSDRLRGLGKKVWWYTCCCPYYPYANFSSWEYPLIEGRILGWMTHRWRADGFLFWIVNKWNRNDLFKEDDTYFPDYHTYNGNGMPGDGIMMYPGEKHIFPSIKLAQCRDAVEDYEYLQLAATKAGLAAADSVADSIVKSLVDFTRDPAKLRLARRRLVKVICERVETENPGRGLAGANLRSGIAPKP